ncbi:NXPE family member 3-like [Perca fluviatilis]|nr:NXPE family member 3-like [Perca fluviatilis]XP_039648085.1 NXPE family member 3-like [Perca fluviatilis]XP_039648086.1 NXPE family member 3-like [Perca fluviatilis]XP_039648087.1 NXPE family member 3-like [Perca fluviatilis]
MKTIMKARACIRKEYSVLFLCLAVAVLILVLRNMEVLKTSSQFQHEVNSTIMAPRVSTDPDVHRGFCTFQPLSPEDALEERLLLDSIAWPETPLLPTPLILEQTSDPAHSTFTILPGRGGGQWHVGDQLEVRINMADFQGRPKKSGGDLLLARLHNQTLGAGVAGQVVDHLNGSYSAVFSLLWEGDAQVEVMLAHPSEAITVLKRLKSEEPDRISHKSLFRSGSLSETTSCNVCLRPTQQPLCNHTDLRTGNPWFCYKPKKLSCDARIDHAKGTYNQTFKATEEKLFQSGVNMKVYIRASGPANVTVLPKKEGQPEVESSTVKVGPSGYYYQGVWQALSGTKVRQFNAAAISQCLKGKVVHMHGDSTIRQFFEFLNAALPGLKEFDLHSQRVAGPFMALDYANNILVKFRFHSPPIQSPPVLTSKLRYIANEIDDLIGGTDTVVVFGIWAHFATYPMQIYIRRLQSIRRAVVRLLDRAPGTVVVIRTGTPRDVTLIYNDWHSLQCYKVLRTMFKGLNVHLIDAWEMVLAHHLPHNVHPPRPIIENMINVFLSYTCPQKGG